VANPEEDPELKKGVVLIASPNLVEPTFRRTIIFMCDHNEEGSMGLVINRPLEFSLDKILGNIEGLEQYFGKVFLGGPVQRDQLLVLHRIPDILGAKAIVPGVFLGGDLEKLAEQAL